MNDGLKEQIAEMLTGTDRRGRAKKWRFSLERGRGETYRNNLPTLYGLSTYERGSVLAGREQRVFVHQWGDGQEEVAKAELAELRQALPRFRYDDLIETCGSTHTPIAELVSHLPDDTDY